MGERAHIARERTEALFGIAGIQALFHLPQTTHAEFAFNMKAIIILENKDRGEQILAMLR